MKTTRWRLRSPAPVTVHCIKTRLRETSSSRTRWRLRSPAPVTVHWAQSFQSPQAQSTGSWSGQHAVLQGLLSTSGVSQPFPPPTAAVTERMRDCWPPLHVALHEPHVDQSVTSQSWTLPQIWTLQLVSCTRSPVHGSPQFSACCVIFLVRFVVPPPHSFEHSDHAVQTDRVQDLGSSRVQSLVERFDIEPFRKNSLIFQSNEQTL